MYTPRAPWKFDHVWCEGGATCTPMEVTLVFGVKGELHVLPWRLLLCLVWRGELLPWRLLLTTSSFYETLVHVHNAKTMFHK